MLRTAAALVTAFAGTLIVAPLVILISAFDEKSPAIDRWIRRWARWIVAAAGLRVTAVGTENLDPEGRYVLVANHYSYLDIPCLMASIEQPLRFMAKKSLFQVPLFGWGMKAAGFIPIDRKNRKTAVESFDLAAKRIRKGNSILVFPEGGRTATREPREFQRGAFLLAVRAQLPVVPVAIDGTWEALKVGRYAITPGTVTVRIGDPIRSAEQGIRAKEQLTTNARSAVRRMLGLPDESLDPAPTTVAESSEEEIIP